jgi:hypothetical protein
VDGFEYLTVEEELEVTGINVEIDGDVDVVWEGEK